MVITVAAAWLVGSQQTRKRKAGFWLFLLSNVMWVIWGVHDGAHALIVLQVALAILNIRGAYKNERSAAATRQSSGSEAHESA